MELCFNEYPETSMYGYRPSATAGVIFICLFTIGTVVCATRVRRHSWVWPIVLGGSLQVVGWVPRTIAYFDVCSEFLFHWQYADLIVAPVFISAGLYVLLGIAIQRSPENALIPPGDYILLFCGADLISLTVQGIGSVIAASTDTDSIAEQGARIIIAGTIFQLAAMTCFNIFALWFLISVGRLSRLLPWNDAWDNRGPLLPFDRRVIWTAAFIDMLIVARCIFQCIELFQGWDGHLGRSELFMVAFDAAPMVLCLYSYATLLLIAWSYNEEIIQNDHGHGRRKLSSTTTRCTDQSDEYVLSSLRRPPGP